VRNTLSLFLHPLVENIEDKRERNNGDFLRRNIFRSNSRVNSESSEPRSRESGKPRGSTRIFSRYGAVRGRETREQVVQSRRNEGELARLRRHVTSNSRDPGTRFRLRNRERVSAVIRRFNYSRRGGREGDEEIAP